MAKINGLCVIVAAIVFGIFFVHATPVAQQHQLGARQCTWGPSFWCGNLTNAKQCNAVRHCIQTVWEMRDVPVDNDSICKICKDMVTQARDQLRSNETMEELKEVFEGSCNLIPIKPVKKECCKLADDFVPELVEALSSQMNPDQVCSVAGLCNNAEIDQILQKYYSGALDGSLIEEEKESSSTELQSPHTKKRNLLTCGSCNSISTFIAAKFEATDRDDFLENTLHLCGTLSSFSDACASIVLTYFNDIYDHLKQNLNAAGMCHLSGVCAANYHRHPEDEQANKIENEAIDLTSLQGDDIPCELCEQLVNHLRDLLVANTTEAEFKQVLEGLCKQTKSNFRAECLSIVDQYYDVIYNTLVKNLDANGACFMIGVCPKSANSQLLGAEIRPLIPAVEPAELQVTIQKKLGANEPKFTQEELQSMTLPIDHLMGAANPELLVDNGELCTLCEYVLHFIQEALATPTTDDDIKHTVSAICDKLPKGVKGQCHNFIDMYGDAVIALLIQGLNPREVCPKLQMCPKNLNKRNDMEVIAVEPYNSDVSDKPTCPLCLFAVEQAQQQIKDNKSKQHIKNVLDHLCNHLPIKLKGECVDFIETYSSELIDKLISDFKPQEICVSLKLCDNSESYLDDMGISMEDFDSSEDKSGENEIDSNEMPVQIEFQNYSPPNCWLCEEVIKNVEKRVNKHTSKDDIKKALHRSCDKMKRAHLKDECNRYVDRYGDKIATLILKEMEPKMICRELGLCLWSELEDLDIDEALKYDVIAAAPKDDEQLALVPYNRLTGLDDIVVKEPPTCVLCEFVMTKLEADLKNKTTQDEIKKAIENVCHHMPKTVSQSCEKFVEQYASAIIAMIGSVPPKEICTRMQLCLASLDAVVTDEVIECGVCHGVSLALLPYFKKQKDHKNVLTTDLVAIACETLPAKYYTICSEMVAIYGQSILHLSEQPNMNEAMICAEVGKCFDNEKSGLAYVRITA